MVEAVVIAVGCMLVLALRFPVLARWGGFLLVVDSVGSLHPQLGHGVLISLMWLIVGLAVWLYGHLIEAYRNGFWRSWLAMHAFRLPMLRVLRPAFA
ncbi:hypothetical protein [Nocardia noduli]|uniref:hypothetical protein n=1 Tax=Nocardia noduli TaxID=2815722 RepID=UPI001C22B505|nr:hypothetical protein [Nocardia noduli]